MRDGYTSITINSTTTTTSTTSTTITTSSTTTTTSSTTTTATTTTTTTNNNNPKDNVLVSYTPFQNNCVCHIPKIFMLMLSIPLY